VRWMTAVGAKQPGGGKWPEADGLLWRVRDGKADLRAPDVRRVHRRTSPRQADRTRGPRGLRAGKKVK